MAGLDTAQGGTNKQWFLTMQVIIGFASEGELSYCCIISEPSKATDHKI